MIIYSIIQKSPLGNVHRLNIEYYQPEYMALFVSIVAIVASVYIAWRNRKYALAKEEYFKLQQVVERIDAKLLVLENHREKLKIFFEQSFKVSKKTRFYFYRYE